MITRLLNIMGVEAFEESSVPKTTRPADGVKRRLCKNCGETMVYLPGHRAKRYCSDCRRIWHWGIFVGGLAVGAGAALLKLIS